MARKHIDVVVSAVRRLTPRVREYHLTAIDNSPVPAYGPGAHIEVHTGSQQTGLIVRHYSLIGGTEDADDARNTYRIAVQREDDRGGGSAYIHSAFEVGTRLQVSAPVNNFPLDRRDAHSLLIAGGIGITPIYSMARSLARRQRDFTVVYAGRAPEFMAYREELGRLAGSRARFHFSGGQDAGKLDLGALLKHQPPGTTAYVCGPGTMVAATHEASRSAGWAPEQVRSESFGAGPQGDEVPFDVELRQSGRVIRVGKDVSILDALTAAKVDVLWDCRRGECGLCPQTVLATDGPIQHRDRYLSDEERESGETMCICVSRIRGERLVLDV
ncbi:PDR/VanB family oxidoreductase [Variovorax sp. J22R24]|uniref:PDR/VanB family oxidoreductase n=1 Tax=Variovorax gracilis TaxID=3053502 RepID=UPI002578CE4F|nr:PDR/VanB family oxidoreductase [Variovorax sp. J22R24]MDM0110277.1 PDR/VanB family oxidoreductase [Variovorax sp. J22R24]